MNENLKIHSSELITERANFRNGIFEKGALTENDRRPEQTHNTTHSPVGLHHLHMSMARQCH